jgi:hypothetical protein
MNNDILDTNEFHNLLVRYVEASKGNEALNAHDNILHFIRQHFTPKTVEEKDDWILINDRGVKHVCIRSSEMAKQGVVIFSGTLDECVAEKERLKSPPLTKGREENGNEDDMALMICKGKTEMEIYPSCFTCDGDKVLLNGTLEQCESEKKLRESIVGGINQNLFNKLHELGVIATQDEMSDIVCAVEKDKPTPNRDNYREELLRVSETILAALITQEPAEGMQPFYTRTPQEKCDEAIALSKILINSVDKEVKSNPASE